MDKILNKVKQLCEESNTHEYDNNKASSIYRKFNFRGANKELLVNQIFNLLNPVFGY